MGKKNHRDNNTTSGINEPDDPRESENAADTTIYLSCPICGHSFTASGPSPCPVCGHAITNETKVDKFEAREGVTDIEAKAAAEGDRQNADTGNELKKT